MTDADPYAWRDPFDCFTSAEMASAVRRATETAYLRGLTQKVSSMTASELTRRAVHDEIVAYVASLHFNDTLAHHFLKLAMDSMKFVALNGYRAPSHDGGDGG